MRCVFVVDDEQCDNEGVWEIVLPAIDDEPPFNAEMPLEACVCDQHREMAAMQMANMTPVPGYYRLKLLKIMRKVGQA